MVYSSGILNCCVTSRLHTAGVRVFVIFLIIIRLLPVGVIGRSTAFQLQTTEHIIN